MLMRAVSGLMYPTSGTISIDGKVLGKNMAFPEKIGMLIENPAFIDSYTGYDNLKMLASINKGEVDISRALETVGLNPQDKRKYRKYGSSLFRVGNCIISLRNFSAPVHSLPSEIMTS